MSPVTSSTLHMLGRFDDPYTGAERELLDLQKMISGRRPSQLWSTEPPHHFYAGGSVRTIKAFAGQFPKSGTLLLAGVHVALSIWLKYARFERVILLYNLASHERLFTMLQVLREATGCEPEVVFVSRALQLSTGLPGRVINSFIDLEPFISKSPVKNHGHTVTVGRVSRDVPEKHHDDDPSLYRMLAAQGVRVRIMGGTCLADRLQDVDGVELLAAGSENAADFYRTLDVFFYRTGTVAEAYGRVVIEAMASGLPVVAGNIGGYAEVIRPGVTGLLVQSQEEAYDALATLIAQPLLARQMGSNARDDIVLRHGRPAADALIKSWLIAVAV